MYIRHKHEHITYKRLDAFPLYYKIWCPCFVFSGSRQHTKSSDVNRKQFIPTFTIIHAYMYITHST